MILNLNALEALFVLVCITWKVVGASAMTLCVETFFLEQRGEAVNKSWINRWISMELRTGPIGGAIRFTLIHIASTRQGWSKQM